MVEQLSESVIPHTLFYIIYSIREYTPYITGIPIFCTLRPECMQEMETIRICLSEKKKTEIAVNKSLNAGLIANLRRRNPAFLRPQGTLRAEAESLDALKFLSSQKSLSSQTQQKKEEKNMKSLLNVSKTSA